MQIYSYEETISAIKGFSTVDLSISQLEYLHDLLKVRAGVVEKEIQTKKIRSET